MIAADHPDRRGSRLLAINAGGSIQHLRRGEFSSALAPGDLVIANDAATLPASLKGVHCPTGEAIEVRLAGWESISDPTRFVAIAFGGGDYRTRTEERPPPPALSADDCLALGPLAAVVESMLDHPRLLRLRFLGDAHSVLAGVAAHGRPVQYAHVPAPLALWDVWTPIAGPPVAFESPSAGFTLDWRSLALMRSCGIRFATLTHAAGISSTGDPELDNLLPLDEPYSIPVQTAAAVNEMRADGGRIIA